MKMRAFTVALLLAGWAAAACGTFAQGIVVIDPWMPTLETGTVWKAELDAEGDWFDGTLWTDGVPNLQIPAYLINGSETLLTGGEAEAMSLTLSTPSFGRSRLTQTGGQLSLANGLSIVDGVYRQLGGRLNARSIDVGVASFFDLLPDLSEVPRPEMLCSETDGGFCIPDLVFQATEKRFQLDGGEAQFADGITVGQGQLEVLGGRLQASSLFVDAQSSTNSNPEFLQRGGIVQIDGEAKIQDGTFALSGGELSVERLAMGDPTVNAFPFVLGPIVRSPEFLQTGGSLLVAENLELCIPGSVINFPPLTQTITDVTYRLQAGVVEVAGDTVVGSLGLAPARFLQSGGVHRTVGTLRVEGAESRYELSGGELHVGTLAIGTDVFNEGGKFALSTGAEFITDSGLLLGSLAEVQADAGSRMRIEGGDVEVWGDDPSLLVDLQNVSLQFAGASELSSLEAASADLGKHDAGFQNNFAWDELLVGDENEAAHLQLVDNHENTPGLDAVYVDRLVVAAGSSLYLSGINLYYREAEIAGEVITSGGVLAAVPVPEPATALLLSQLWVRLLAKRKRSRQP